MTKPNSPETQQQHTARMLRWQKEDAAALKAGKLRPAHLRPALRTTIVSSTNEPTKPTPKATKKLLRHWWRKAVATPPASDISPIWRTNQRRKELNELNFAGFSVSDIAELKAKAKNGDAEAQAKLGDCYFYGNGVPQDYAEAAKWFWKAAEQGNAVGQFFVGQSYAQGVGVPKDAGCSVGWYRKAAEQGYVRAQFNLGVCYDEGSGVPQDYAEAAKWYRRAADQYFAPAQFNLGKMCEKGIGVMQDYTAAVDWLRKAANQDFAPAQNALGRLLASGDGVACMKSTVLLFFTLACVLLVGCKPKSAVSTATHDHSVTLAELNPYLIIELTNLDHRVSALEAHNNREWVAIDPYSKSYQQLWTPFGVLLVTTKNLTPYLDGYKVKIAIGNPYNVTFTGFQLAYWCDNKGFTFSEAKTPAKPWEQFQKAQNTKTQGGTETSSVFTPPPLSSKETVEDRTEILYPGSWNELEFTVAPATADDIRHLRMSIHVNELILKKDSASN